MKSKSERMASNISAGQSLRQVLFLLLFITGLVVLIGSGLNHLNHKYVRAMPTSTCRNHILNIAIEGDILCCEKHLHHYDWVCVGAFDAINRILASTYALSLPFLPLLITSITELIILLRRPYDQDKCIKYVRSTTLRAFLIGWIVITRTVSTIS